jgi:hypothetical protein
MALSRDAFDTSWKMKTADPNTPTQTKTADPFGRYRRL